MDDRAIARWRMRSLALAGRTFTSAESVVGGLLAVQAENHAQASWALAERTSGLTESSFGRLFDDGAVLRTHVLRPTWHFVLPDDLRWLTELTAPRIRRSWDTVRRDLGLDAAEVASSEEVVVEALSGGTQLTRDELAEHLDEAAMPCSGQALGLVLMSAELSTLICSGAVRAGAHTYALVEDRAPGGRALARDEALVELVTRYFTSHGPATERDLGYWATMTLTDVRRGLEGASDRLDSFEHDGRTYWFGEPPPPPGDLMPRGHLLQILDEYFRGYQDSRDHLDAMGLVPGGRATSMGMALVDGQMVGDMRRTIGRGQARFDVDPYRALASDESGALADAATRYGEFLGLDASLTIGDPP